MGIQYSEAVEILKVSAQSMRAATLLSPENVPLHQAIGRVVAEDYRSPVSTPPFDTSAMDGYAIDSSLTASASPMSPVTFRIKSTQAAGDDTTWLKIEPFDCVEIMTGARFPESPAHQSRLDACVRVEHTKLLSEKSNGHSCIQISQPVAPNANRRLAGSDFKMDDPVVSSGETIRAQHILALASLDIQVLSVRRKPRIGIWSTGKELLPINCSKRHTSQIPDANGPYLAAALREYGADVEFLGTIGDDLDVTKTILSREAEKGLFDILITSGAVSKGRFDYVPAALDACGANIHFHGVAIRPGHPVLFASIPVTSSINNNLYTPISNPRRPPVTFFGLPGNPIAAAACLRFIVAPYIRERQDMPHEKSVTARLSIPDSDVSIPPSTVDVFRHGSLSSHEGILLVSPNAAQSPAKIRPFTNGNCWIHLPASRDVIKHGDVVRCYTISLGEGLFE